MSSLFDLSGKTALVTGATHGLGMAMAKALAEHGARLLINGHSPEKMDKALAQYKAWGIDAKGYLFDVTDENQVDVAIKSIENEFGAIDILVNNAGKIQRTPALEMAASDFRSIIDVDLVAPFIVSKRVAPGMIKKRSGKNN